MHVLSPTGRALASAVLLATALAAVPAQAQTADSVAERFATMSCATSPGVRVDADGLVRFAVDALPDSAHVCFVSRSRTAGGVQEARLRIYPPRALIEPQIASMLEGLAAEFGNQDSAADLTAAAGTISRLLAHAVVIEVDEAVRCDTGDILRQSAGYYDLAGVRLMDVPISASAAAEYGQTVRQLCQVP